MIPDLAELRVALLEAVRAATNPGAVAALDRLCRRVRLETWRAVAFGEVHRPGAVLEALRPARLAADAAAAEAIGRLEEEIGLAVAAMPRPIPASEAPRNDTERAILAVLAGVDRPLVRSEVHSRLGAPVSLPAVGQALERLAARELVIRRLERRQGAKEASVWTLNPAARPLVAARAVAVPVPAERVAVAYPEPELAFAEGGTRLRTQET